MKTLVLILFLLPLLGQAQIFENFEDGNYTQNPHWFGNGDRFIVNASKQLQLHDTVAGTAYLSTANRKALFSQWLIWTKAGFSPSANNNLRIYLMSNRKDLSGSLHGYYLQLGEKGNNDAIELFRQDGKANVSVCRGRKGVVASAFVIRIKVLRDSLGNWQIFTAPSGEESFHKETAGKDDTYDSSAYFGFYCKYTKSNSAKMYFDDIYVGPWVQDTIPPSLVSIKVDSDSTLFLLFSEGLDQATVEDTTNYELFPRSGNILSARLGINSKSLQLFFSKHFKNATRYQLNVSGIKDVAGNMLKGRQYPFIFYKPKPHDVVINEIMADPVPAKGLPGFEYLELYNQTGFDIDMSGWQLKIGTRVKTIDSILLKAKGYLIVAGPTGAAVLSSYGSVFRFSSFSLTNKGQTLLLSDSKGQGISQVTYSDTWYLDDTKSGGGWSLEQINPANNCSFSENWRASQNSQGGTPGTQNSVFDNRIFYPKLLRFQIHGNDSIEIRFTQTMDNNSLVYKKSWWVTPNVGSPDTVCVYPSPPTMALLHFPIPFEQGKIYTLHLSAALQNRAGFRMEHDTSFIFGLPQAVGEKDLIINEVLFNPFNGGVDYVELYNQSRKIIDLQELRLGSVKTHIANAPDTLYFTVSTSQLLMFPKTYIVLTSSPQIVQQQYFTPYPTGFLKMSPFPVYGSKSGSVLLEAQSGEMIDAFDYSEDMHFPLIHNTKGVSLERTQFDGKTNNRGNWHSAAESVGFGTPAYQNSQFVYSKVSSDEIQIDPEIFSPDGDGYQDVLQIKYHFSKAGYAVHIDIFNSDGYLIRQLVKNEYLGTTGVFSWDGLQDNNTKAPPGIYIFYIQIFDMEGHVKNYRKAGVLAVRFQ